MTKLGVILVGGAGIVAVGGHIPSWKTNPRARLLALVDRNEQKVKEVCQRFGVKSYYTNLEDALCTEKDAQVVDLATPTSLHFPQALLCLREGKNVIMEKPMATRQEECRELINLAAERELKLSVFHTFKGYPIVWKIKKMIDEDKLGDNLFISFLVSYVEQGLQSWWKGVKTAIIREFGVHRIYVSSFWLDGIHDVKVVPHRKRSDGMLDSATVVLYGAKGICEITIIKAEREIGDEIRIFGSKEKIILPPLPGCGYQRIGAPEEPDYRRTMVKEFKRFVPPLGMIDRGFKYALFGKKVLPHYVISDNFVRSIIGNEQRLVPPEEGLEAVRVLDKIDEICREV